MGKDTDLVINFSSVSAREHFARWLSGQGEQDYWNWMEYREEEEDGDITATKFLYHGNEEGKHTQFLEEGIIYTVCGRRKMSDKESSRLFDELSTSMSKIEDESILMQAGIFLLNFDELLNKRDTRNLPPFRLNIAANGDVSIEWWFTDRRLSLCFESEKEKSYYIFVSKPEAGGHMENGPLNIEGVENISVIENLLNKVLA